MSSKLTQQVLLRVFVFTNSESEARQSAPKLTEILGTVGIVHTRTVQQYWKIPEYFEILLSISRTTDEDSLIVAIKEILTEDWQEVTPEPNRSDVWDYDSSPSFVLPEARWANIEVVHPHVN